MRRLRGRYGNCAETFWLKDSCKADEGSVRYLNASMIGDLHFVTFENAVSGVEHKCHVVEPGRGKKTTGNHAGKAKA